MTVLLEASNHNNSHIVFEFLGELDYKISISLVRKIIICSLIGSLLGYTFLQNKK